MKQTLLKSKFKNYMKRILKSTFVMKCLSVLIYIYAIFAGKTTKWTVKGIDNLIKDTKDSNAIIVGWHSRTTMLPFFWNRYIKLKLSVVLLPTVPGNLRRH